MSIKYFAYGSNMSIPRLEERVELIGDMGCYKLRQHKLMFHKVSNDGSGKCDVFFTGNDEDYVLGLIFEIPKSQKRKLDRVEGVGYGYKEGIVSVESTNGGADLEAITYIATNVDSTLVPFEWYKYHVIYGAKEAGFPEEYLHSIEEVTAKKDLDKKRKSRELFIYK